MSADTAHILFVDDEAPVLRSLKRLLRPTGHKVHIANSGAEGLDVLSEQPIDVVVSDMRMPEMDGAEFLTNVSEQWPETTRMLLTGYADLTSAINAINNGSISRYLTKPWQDADIVMSIEQAIETRRLAQEKTRLEALTSQQNEELRALNDSLEKKVADRTRAIEEARQTLAAAHEDLQASYRTTIEIFSRLVNTRNGRDSCLSVAHDAKAVGGLMHLDDAQCQALYEAGLLCDIGKLALPDSAVAEPYTDLDVNAQRNFQRHPVIAETTLVSLEPLASAAAIVRQHCERFDGRGFPDKIPGEEIPLAARILAVCKAYADLLDGKIFEERMTVVEARSYLSEEKGKWFDPAVVDVFVAWLDDKRRRADDARELKLELNKLRVGMTMSRDLFTENDVLILARGQTVTDALLARLLKLQESIEEPMVVHVEG